MPDNDNRTHDDHGAEDGADERRRRQLAARTTASRRPGWQGWADREPGLSRSA